MKKYYFVAIPENKPNQIILGGVTKDEALKAIPQIKQQLKNIKVVTWTLIQGEDDEQEQPSQPGL